jgi:acyl-homoserine-lactone acylase
MINILFIIIISSLLSGESVLPHKDLFINDSLFSAKIKRDNWGVPHIYGRTDSDVSFGLAYAHSEDDFETIQYIIYASRGELASVYGRDAAVNDYYVQLMNFWGLIEKNYESDVTYEVKLLCEGYAAGINKYLADNPELQDKTFGFVSPEDIIAGFSHRMPLMFGLDGVLKKLSKKNPPEILGENEDLQSGIFDMVASNVMAIAPQRSLDGYTRLWLNTHQPWDGPVAWYEAYLKSEEGWDFYGALFPGSPVPLIGHNKDLGWSHTVNSPDLIDVYKLTVNKQNKNQYWFEGYWKDFEIREVDIKVKIIGPFSWTFKRIIKKSIHGPVIEFDHGSYGLRISSIKNLRFLEQWYSMGKSRNIEEFKESMKIHAIPMFNTGYADKTGNIYYVYNAKIPKRNNKYDWNKILPGESKQALWYDYIPYNKLPYVENPIEGFFQNCNSTPYLATGNRVDSSKPLPDWTGIEKHQNNRSLRALETFGIDPSISRDEFFNYKYDVEYSRESIIAEVRKRYLDDMLAENITGELKEGLDIIRKWNLKADSLNTEAALSILTLPNAFRFEDLKYNKDSITVALSENIKFFKKKYGSLNVPLGHVFRLIRGDIDLPLEGGPGLLRAIYIKKIKNTYQGVAGDCYIQAVEWDPSGNVSSWSVHQYGSATKDKNSIHYNDQSFLFSKHQMKQIR